MRKIDKNKRITPGAINVSLEIFLKELRLKTASIGYVLPRIISWRRGEASKVSQSFCEVLGILEITFYAMRACFAVQCTLSGLDVLTTMKLGG